MKELYCRTLEDGVWRYLDLFFHLANLKRRTGDLKRGNLINLFFRQGKEYFQTSKEATVLTKPLLLYYGMLNLSKALILLRNSGVTPGSFHIHGLRAVPVNVNKKSLLTLRCYVQLRGVFSDLLRCGTKDRYSIETIRETTAVNEDVTSEFPLQRQTASEKKYGVSEIISVIPELVDLVTDNTGNKPRMARIHTLQLARPTPGRTRPARPPAAKLVIVHNDQKRIKETVRSFDNRKTLRDWQFKEESFDVFIYEIHSIQDDYCYPHIRETLFREKFGLFDSRRKMELPEIIMHYLLMFILGNAARYLPDLWYRFMERKVNEKIIIETFLNTSEIKFPLLLLRELRDELVCLRTA